MRWLLTQLAADPSREFSERELLVLGVAEFERLRRLKFVRPIPLSGNDWSRFVDDRLLTVQLEEAGGAVGFDPEDPDFEPVVLADADTHVWKPDLITLGAALAKHLELSGRVELVAPRLLFLGHSGASTGVLVALLQDDYTATQAVLSLPHLLAATIKRYALITPSFVPSQQTQRAAAALRISWHSMRGETLDLDPPIGASSGAERGLTLSAYGFEHSPDYRVIRVAGTSYRASVNRARIIQFMDELGAPDTEAHVLAELDIESRRFEEAFKRSPLLKLLFERVGPRTWSLKRS